MAGIVASTLRRKAFHKRAQDTKYQAIDQGHTNVSPTDSRSSSSSTLNRFECRSNVGKTPKGAQLCHVDFWPRCLNCAHPLIGVSNKTSVTNSTNPTANSGNKSSHKSHLSSNHNISNNLNPALLTVPQVGSGKRNSSVADKSGTSHLQHLIQQQHKEENIKLAQFESFDTLVPKANAWLQSNPNIRLIKCETIEKKVSSLDDVMTDHVMFVPKKRYAIYLKGLRLWYIHTQPLNTTTTSIAASTTPNRRYNTTTTTTSTTTTTTGILKQHSTTTASTATTSAAQRQQQQPQHHHQHQQLHLPPTEIGYMNVIPRCLDFTGKYPTYENLPETYSAINAYLSNNPLEGKIITIETVGLKLPRKQWSTHDIKPDQTCFQDEYIRHTLYITRIYFCYGPPEVELIGAQDFLPDFENAIHWRSLYKNRPKYSVIGSALSKARDWIQSVRNIAITNVQTLEAAYKHRPGNVHTGVNFIEKSECSYTVRFIRITYVRPSEDLAELLHSLYSPPTSLTYKTFVPPPVKVAMCSGAPEYENFGVTWERAKVWLRSVDRRIVSVETFYHPLHKVWHGQDGGETSVVMGEWTSNKRDRKRTAERKKLVNIVRVYLDGEYQEPPSYMLPPLPMVEEINDCKCTIM